MFLKVVHCVILRNDGLVYVGDRSGNRVEVFDKMGNFERNILVESKTATLTGAGSISWIGFSRDPAQKFMYVANSGDEEMRVLERETGKALYTFGRPGLQTGEFNGLHTIAVNSKGDIITGEANVYPMGGGRRIQVFKLVHE